MNKNFEKISEKILPLKIRNIIWYKNTDLIIVNCGNYFEVQRISFKHETIFKFEEKTEIFHISILDPKETISVILIDGSFKIIDMNNGEVIFSSSFNKTFSKNYLCGEIFSLENYTSETNVKDNPFSNDQLIFNSFSKIDVSKVNYYNNDKFLLNTFFIYDSLNNELEFYQKLLNSFSKIKILKKESENIINVFPFDIEILLFVKMLNNNDYEFNIIKLYNYITYKEHILIYQLAFSKCIVEYISKILSLITKIISKLGYILFDKYTDANELSLKIDSSNEKEYQKEFNEQLKKLYLFGNISENIKNFLQKDLFESKSILKMDEKIHFNLKNVQDILIENVKPSLNRLGYYLNQIKLYSGIMESKSEEKLNNNFRELYILFDNFLEELLQENLDYRNFLSWINSFNCKENNNNYNNSLKNYLNNILIDYEHVLNFINNYHYNLKNILSKIQNEEEEKKVIKNNQNKFEIKIESTIDKTKNLALQRFLKENNLNITKELNSHNLMDFHLEKNTKNTIRDYLSLLDQNIDNIQKNFNEFLSNKMENIPIKFFTLKNIQSKITDLSYIQNETNDFIFSFTNNESFKSILYLIVYNKSTSEFKISKINFTYENDIKILDYKITKQNELILLVKTVNIENNLPLIKYTLILSVLTNYNFNLLKSENNNTFNLFDYGNVEDIKIDTFADVECSDNSFISVGDRRLLALVNNTSNKITIIDILNN